MKIKINKKFFKTFSVAALCSIAVTMAIGILAAVSWGFVFAALLILFMPICDGAVKFYEKNHCMSLPHFFKLLMEDENDNMIK